MVFTLLYVFFFVPINELLQKFLFLSYLIPFVLRKQPVVSNPFYRKNKRVRFFLVFGVENPGMKKVLRVGIVEDDAKYHLIIKGYLDSYAKDKEIEFQVRCFDNGLDFLETYDGNYDFLFRDIERPQIDGLQVCSRLREKDAYLPIIIISHSASYAVKGYTVDAFGYVLKPIVPFDFYFLLDKVINRISENKKDYLVISNKSRLKRIDTDDILYLEVSSDTIKIKTKEERIEVRGKIKDYEKKLSSDFFFRCSNSFLVNLKYCRNVNIGESTITIGDKIISISRPKKKEFLDCLAGYLKEEI